MLSPLVQSTAQIICMHGGQATALTPNVRVELGGAPSLLITAPVVVAGCALPPSVAGNGPCVSANWVTGTTRVKSGGQPLVVQSSLSKSVPSGTPLQVVVTQQRVTAQ